MLITLIIMSMFALIRAYIDKIIIGNDVKINHIENATLTIILSLILASFNDKFIISFFTCLTYYWILFDLLLNYMRGLPLNYTGKEALTDKFLNKIGNGITFKCVLFTLLIIIYSL